MRYWFLTTFYLWIEKDKNGFFCFLIVIFLISENVLISRSIFYFSSKEQQLINSSYTEREK